MDDELVFRVYATDHSYVTLRVRLDERAGEIKLLAANKLKLEESNELILVHVKSNGERIIFNDLDSNLSTGLSVNGRIFVCPLDHIDAISPLADQDPFQEAYATATATANHAQSNVLNADGSSTQDLTSTANNNNNTSSLNQTLLQQQLGQTNGPLGANNNQLMNANINNNSSAFANSNNINNNNHNYNSAGQNQQQQQIEFQQQQQQNIISSHLLNQTPTNLIDTKTHMSLSNSRLEEFSSRDIAYCLTQLAWSLLKNMHEYELIYAVFGHQRQPMNSNEMQQQQQQATSNSKGLNNKGSFGHQNSIESTANRSSNNQQQQQQQRRNSNAANNLLNFSCQTNHKPITANLNVFLRHFNELQYWVVTQICLSNSLSKRAQVLRKFIKIAAQ